MRKARRARHSRGKKRGMCVTNPYKFTKATQDGKGGISKKHKRGTGKTSTETHSDESQWGHLGNCERIVNVPEIPMNINVPSWKEV